MMKTILKLASLSVLASCAPGNPPVRVAELCIANQEGVGQLYAELQAIAKEEKMDFVDASKATELQLKTIEYDDRGRGNASPTIHIAVQRNDGMGVTAGNMGLPGYQVALGFSEGSNRSEAIRFADKVTNRLGKHWKLNVLPTGSGVTPNPKCN